MRDWLNSISPRERIMVLACAVFIAVALLWTMGVRPLLAQRALLESRVASKETQLANYQELASLAGPQNQSGQSPVQGRGESTVVIIDRTTRERQLAGYLKRNQPESASSVRLRFEGAPFDLLIAWLGELNQSYGMTTISANFDESGPGRVNCSLVLNRPGA